MNEQNTVEVVDIQFRPGQKCYFFDPAGHTCQKGDYVIIDTARGPEYGCCVSGNHHISEKEIVAPLRPVVRHATEQDQRIAAANQKKEADAFRLCAAMIAEQKLDMQLVSAECSFDGSKILFFFTADERVDFRELVKNLAAAFHTRIELRQIGVRDKAKMVGGLGICGRPFCCTEFLDDFQPVSIKMAKTQNLSLNPTKISGTCGRLMCCLKYEQETYEDLIRTSPKLDSFVDTPEGRGTVVELNLQRQRVKVRFETRPDAIGNFANDEIAILRNGKGKKTDAPIPADLAPISGNGAKRRFQKELPEDGPVLDSIKFRYSEETIAEDVVAPAAEEPKEHRNRNRHKKGRGNGNKPQAEKPQAEKTAAEKPQAEKSEEGAPKKHHHRHRHHRHHKPKNNENK